VVVSVWFSDPMWLGQHVLVCVARRTTALLPAGGGRGQGGLVPQHEVEALQRGLTPQVQLSPFRLVMSDITCNVC